MRTNAPCPVSDDKLGRRELPGVAHMIVVHMAQDDNVNFGRLQSSYSQRVADIRDSINRLPGPQMRLNICGIVVEISSDT